MEEHASAAMVTVAQDGTPRVARVGIALVDGKLWSSGTQDRVRTKRLRRDPRCTLFVFEAGWKWLTLDTTVRILEGDDAPELSLRLVRTMQKKPTGPLGWLTGDLSEEEFLAAMVEEKRSSTSSTSSAPTECADRAPRPGVGTLCREHHGLEHGALVDRISEALPADS